MPTTARPSRKRATPSRSLAFSVEVDEYRSMPIPGIPGAKLGTCHIPVTEIPQELDRFLQVNPRVPSRTKKGVLSGPVVKGITDTLTGDPEAMVLRNQGLYLLVAETSFQRKSRKGQLEVTLTDPEIHGLVNGGHTYAAIRDAVERATEDELESLKRAFVRLHIMQGIAPDQVADIAEGLNRSKQVDDPSLMDLRSEFEQIKLAMKGHKGADEIAYYQGADGDLYIAEVLVYLAMFNKERFDSRKHPYGLHQRQHMAREYFKKDVDADPSPMDLVIPHLPEILTLSDQIRKAVPDAARRNGFQYGRMKTGKTETAGSKKLKGKVRLPFLGEMMDHRVPAAWVYPILAGFRANIDWDLSERRFEWYMPLDELLPKVIDDLVMVCIKEHRDNPYQPEAVGRRESAYSQCYDKVMICLATSGALKA